MKIENKGFRARSRNVLNSGVRYRFNAERKAKESVPYRYFPENAKNFKFKILKKIEGYELVIKNYKHKCAYDLYEIFGTQRKIMFPSHEIQIELAQEGVIKGKIMFPFLVFNKFLSDSKKLVGLYTTETTGAGNNMIFHDLSMPISSFSVVTLKKAG